MKKFVKETANRTIQAPRLLSGRSTVMEPMAGRTGEGSDRRVGLERRGMWFDS